MKIGYSIKKLKENRKQFFRVLFILVVLIVFVYIVPYTFLIMESRSRAIFGIIFQFLAGLIFVADQTLGKMPEVEIEKINKRLTRTLVNKQPKLVLLVLLAIFPFVMLAWLWISNPTEMSYEVFGGLIVWLLFGYYIYIVFLQTLNKLVVKLKYKKKEEALYYSNAILFGCSLPLLGLLIYLGRLQVSDTIFQVLRGAAILLVSFCIPAILLSGSYYLVLGGVALIKLFYLRFKQRYILWMIILALWTWSSALLLMNALSSD